ncbi:UDP-glucose 6-dehydrogenase, partial [Streptomyces sp. NPDC058171]
LRFTDSYEEAAAFASVHFIGVGTPQKKGEFAADLKYVDAVVETLAPLITEDSVIFGKSTVPVGTAERLAARASELAKEGVVVELAWNPEFLREGFAVEDTLHPDRLVVGVDRNADGRAEGVAREV